ncbi:MAG: transglycosylase SLT domain-containing protein [Culturomica sp.]|jgi:membrane-bound lytic murein transglycosylase D|nr:transglycosylase SLT domain-containing protein [Culturomica sp.]
MRFWIISTLLLAVIDVKADKDSVTVKQITNQVVSNNELTDTIPDNFVKAIDDFYYFWKVEQKLSGIEEMDEDYKDEGNIQFPDSVYLARLDSLNSAIRLSYNDIVKQYIDLYMTKRRAQVASMIGNSDYYFPIFEQALADNCMPLELKYLPVIESALNPLARSRVGASGLWQFMYYTGKQYKLDINSFIDERFDPEKSTVAAISFLNDLYQMYNDWILVIAAYNCGPGNVNKAIRRSGGKKNYWDIYYYLPRETRGYVPAFIAAMYVFNYYDKHNIHPTATSLPIVCDSIIVTDALHFEQLANNMDISVEELRAINPQYIKDIVPAGYGKTYSVKLPYEYIGSFIDNQDSIFAYKRGFYFNERDRMVNPNERFKRYAHVASVSGDKVRMVYTVRDGDVAGKIADDFGVRLSDLCYWNNLNRKRTVRIGQKLNIYLSPAKAEKYRSKARFAGNVSNKTDAPKVETIDGDFILYTVRKGDNLWTIAKKYPGVSNIDIMRWNGISENDVKNIKPGKRLKIKI